MQRTHGSHTLTAAYHVCPELSHTKLLVCSWSSRYSQACSRKLLPAEFWGSRPWKNSDWITYGIGSICWNTCSISNAAEKWRDFVHWILWVWTCSLSPLLHHTWWTFPPWESSWRPKSDQEMYSARWFSFQVWKIASQQCCLQSGRTPLRYCW